MRRVVYYISITLDGMYAEPDGSLGPFEPSEDEHRYANDLVRDAGDMVIGRRMYDVMAYWDELELTDEHSDVERDFAQQWRATPKHVVSRGSPTLRANARQVEGDVVEALGAMRAADGPPILLGGGAELFATAAGAGLIDEVRLRILPTGQGQGMALFAALARPLRLRLVDARPFDGGSVLLSYVPRDRDDT